MDLAGRAPPAGVPPPRLLGAFDPILLGWTSRAEFVAKHEAAVVSGGIFRPIALVEGRAAGTWTFQGGRVELQPFGRMSRDHASALDADAADVIRFFEA